MSSSLLILGAAALAAICGLWIFFDLKIHAIRKAWEHDVEEMENENRKKNGLKESMESGDDSSDFDTSLDILRDLAAKRRRSDS